MRFWLGTICLLFSLGLGLIQEGALTVTAAVAPYRSVVLDMNGKIISVTSNTSESVTPVFFFKGQKITPNESQRIEYESIISTLDTSEAFLYHLQHNDNLLSNFLMSLNSKLKVQL